MTDYQHGLTLAPARRMAITVTCSGHTRRVSTEGRVEAVVRLLKRLMLLKRLQIAA